VVAISPILLYIGMLMCAQAFETTPREHAPAIALSLTPHLAAWATTLLAGALGAAGMNFGAMHAPDFVAKMGQNGVLFHGLEVMGGGSILTGLVLGAIAVFVIERKFLNASAFALAGAVMTYFGFMHGEAIGIGGGLGVTPGVALAYAVVAAGLYAAEKFGTAPLTVPQSEPHLAVPAE
jgi:AGZA family xanthine/uracil permease-like MFS transporter